MNDWTSFFHGLRNVEGIRKTVWKREIKRKMPWNVFLSLLMCFTQNEKTAPIIKSIGAFPDELREILNVNNRKQEVK